MKGTIAYKRFAFLLLLLLLLYLSLYTWNLKSGVLDRLAGNTGLEAVTLILKPGKWAADRATGFWNRYIYLVDLRQENDRLHDSMGKLIMENVRLRERALQAERLEKLMGFTPPGRWERLGARVIAHEMGPAGALTTVLVDSGSLAGVERDAPVLMPGGVVGRVLRVSPHGSTLLLLTDPNSRIAVLGRESRTAGVLTGGGPGEPLSVLYMPLNAPLKEGEVLVTSGLAGIYPKGIPVARVTRIERSDISLFQDVSAEPLVDVKSLEEVLLLRRVPLSEPGSAGDSATPSEAPVPEEAPAKQDG